MHAGWSQGLHSLTRPQAISQQSWASSNHSSHHVTAAKYSHPHSTPQAALSTHLQTNAYSQSPVPKPEPIAQKQLHQYTSIRLDRPTNNPYDSKSFGQQQQAEQPWLQGVNRCLVKLAGITSDEQLHNSTLSVPWAWLVRDLIHLLPPSSCYSYFTDSDSLFCQFLQQLTADDVDTLSEPGARMLAGILCALAQHDSTALAEYIKASPAVLQRVREVCVALCNSNRGADAAEYLVNVLGCLLVHHKSGVYSISKQQAMKQALCTLLLLPTDLQSSACAKLLKMHQSFHALFLKMKDLPESLGHSQITLAAQHFECWSKTHKHASQKEASKLWEWPIWAAAATYQDTPTVMMVQLAVHANAVVQQARNAKLHATTLSPVYEYIGMMRQACQPDKLNLVLANAHDHSEVHVARMVYWVALLYSTAQQSISQRAGGISKHQMYEYLSRVTSSISTDAMEPACLQGMFCALHRLGLSMDTHGQYQLPRLSTDTMLM